MMGRKAMRFEDDDASCPFWLGILHRHRILLMVFSSREPLSSRADECRLKGREASSLKVVKLRREKVAGSA